MTRIVRALIICLAATPVLGGTGCGDDAEQTTVAQEIPEIPSGEKLGNKPLAPPKR